MHTNNEQQLKKLSIYNILFLFVTLSCYLLPKDGNIESQLSGLLLVKHSEVPQLLSANTDSKLPRVHILAISK